MGLCCFLSNSCIFFIFFRTIALFSEVGLCCFLKSPSRLQKDWILSMEVGALALWVWSLKLFIKEVGMSLGKQAQNDLKIPPFFFFLFFLTRMFLVGFNFEFSVFFDKQNHSQDFNGQRGQIIVPLFWGSLPLFLNELRLFE